MRELSLREIQLKSLEIAVKIDKICNQLGLKYFLMYGSLIGAVRHNGFIPWDDDLDIMLPRYDYDKLKEYFISHESEMFPLKLCNRSITKNYPYPIERVSDSRYLYIPNGMEVAEMSFEQGVFVDLYPLDNVASVKKAKWKLKRIACLNTLNSIYVCEDSPSKIKKSIKHVISYILHALYPNTFNGDEKVRRIATKGSSDSDLFCCMMVSPLGTSILRKDWFDKIIRCKFEGYELCIPANFDSILKLLYGEYMKLPPEEERIAHHFYKIYEINCNK